MKFSSIGPKTLLVQDICWLTYTCDSSVGRVMDCRQSDDWRTLMIAQLAEQWTVDYYVMSDNARDSSVGRAVDCRRWDGYLVSPPRSPLVAGLILAHKRNYFFIHAAFQITILVALHVTWIPGTNHNRQIHILHVFFWWTIIIRYIYYIFSSSFGCWFNSG